MQKLPYILQAVVLGLVIRECSIISMALSTYTRFSKHVDVGWSYDHVILQNISTVLPLKVLSVVLKSVCCETLHVVNMWVDCRGSLSTLYSDGQISTCR